MLLPPAWGIATPDPQMPNIAPPAYQAQNSVSKTPQPLNKIMTNVYAPQQEPRLRQGAVRRSFVPGRNRRYGVPTFPVKQLVKYSPKWKYCRLFNFPQPGAPWLPRMNTIVVQVHGVASPNSTTHPDAKASGGVYFGPGAPHNRTFPLPAYMEQTNNRAVLEAIRTTLNELIQMRHTGLDPRWKEIIIMTNSEYAKKSLSYWVWSWERNGWNHMTRQGELIANLDVMQDLHNLLIYIETTLNMAIRFWKVGREDVAGADELAKISQVRGRQNGNGAAGIPEFLQAGNVDVQGLDATMRRLSMS